MAEYTEGESVTGTVTQFALKFSSIPSKVDGSPKPVLVVFVQTPNGSLQWDGFVDEDPYNGTTSRAETMKRLSELAGTDIPWTAELPGLVGSKCLAVPEWAATKKGGFWKAKYLNPLVRNAMNASQLSLLFSAPVQKPRADEVGFDPQTDDNESEADHLPRRRRSRNEDDIPF